MNKKILVSLSIIGVVAAMAIGGTIAYFNDTETSTGNIFIAGSLDLKIDHTMQTYNDVDCKTCNVEIKSDTSNIVVSTVDGDDPVPFPHPAVQVSNPHPAWTVTGDIPDATWVWATDPTTAHDSGNVDVYYTFEKTFEWWGPITGITLSLGVGTDNGYQIKLNGNIVGTDWGEYNYKSPADVYTNFGSYIVQGTNVLSVEVKNKAMAGGTPAKNPAGLLYKLVIDGQCGDDYFKTHCKLWDLKDLEGEKFFDFDDVKPGDRGTNLISLHVYDNDAWGCLFVDDIADEENEFTEPEGLVDSTPEGELSQHLSFVIWKDDNQNGIYESGETILFGPGQLTSPITKITLADSLTDNPIQASITQYLGLAWCAGTQTVEQDDTITCDGTSMGNECQSDSMTADLTIYAEQWRNNDEFECADVTLYPQP